MPRIFMDLVDKSAFYIRCVFSRNKYICLDAVYSIYLKSNFSNSVKKKEVKLMNSFVFYKEIFENCQKSTSICLISTWNLLEQDSLHEY